MTLRHTLNPADMDTDPVDYMRELMPVVIEVVGEVNAAIYSDDQALLRRACLRLTSIGALAGIISRKLDAEATTVKQLPEDLDDVVAARQRLDYDRRVRRMRGLAGDA